MRGDVLAHGMKLRLLRRIHAAANPHLIRRHVKVQPRSLVFRQAAGRKIRGHVRLVRSLVLRKADVAVNAVHRRRRVGDVLGTEPAKVVRQPGDDVGHRLTDVRLVIVAMRGEPLAAVVPLERAQKSKRVAGEPRG